MNKTILTLLLIWNVCVFSSCENHKAVQNIYQPKVLILKPNSIIETKEGVYSSSDKEEIWYSRESISKLEKQLSQF